MRKVLISLAAAAASLAVAAPASAQVYGSVGIGYGNMTPGYGAPAYGYGYGYNNFGQVRALQVRVDSIQRQIAMLDRSRVLSRNESRRLREESRNVERQLYRAARYGLNPYEARNVELRIARLEQHVQREAWDRNGRWGRGDRYGDRDWDHGRDWDHDRD